MKKSILNAVGKRVSFVLTGGWGMLRVGKILSVQKEMVKIRYLNGQGKWSCMTWHQSWIRNVRIISNNREYRNLICYCKQANSAYS